MSIIISIFLAMIFLYFPFAITLIILAMTVIKFKYKQKVPMRLIGLLSLYLLYVAVTIISIIYYNSIEIVDYNSIQKFNQAREISVLLLVGLWIFRSATILFTPTINLINLKSKSLFIVDKVVKIGSFCTIGFISTLFFMWSYESYFESPEITIPSEVAANSIQSITISQNITQYYQFYEVYLLDENQQIIKAYHFDLVDQVSTVTIGDNLLCFADDCIDKNSGEYVAQDDIDPTSDEYKSLTSYQFELDELYNIDAM